jgi:hypothetical protein
MVVRAQSAEWGRDQGWEWEVVDHYRGRGRGGAKDGRNPDREWGRSQRAEELGGRRGLW